MNPRINFIEYLKYFGAFAGQEHARRKAEEEKKPEKERKLVYNLFIESRRTAQKAVEQNDISLIGRVFNNFPYQYKLITEEKEIIVYNALDPKKYYRWSEQTEDLIRNGDYHTEPNPDDPNDPLMSLVTFEPVTIARLQDILQEMIYEAATIILDEDGDVRHEILVATQLREYFNQNKENRKIHDEIVFQVIFSFLTQIIIGSIREVFEEPMSKEISLSKRFSLVMMQFQNECMVAKNAFHFVDMKNGVPKQSTIFLRFQPDHLLYRAHGHARVLQEGAIPLKELPGHFPKTVAEINTSPQYQADIIKKIFSYDLAEWTEKALEMGIIYVRALPEGLEYKVLDQNKKVNSATIKWGLFAADFPKNVPELLQAKETCLPVILGVTEGMHHTGVPLKKFVVTKLFKKQVLDVYFEKSVFSEKAVANFLIHMTPDKVKKIVIDDLNKIPPELFDSVPQNSNQYSRFFEGYIEARAKFWVDIMKYYQDHRELPTLKTFYEIMPAGIISRWKKVPNALELDRQNDFGGIDLLRSTLMKEFSPKSISQEGKEEKLSGRDFDTESEEEVVLTSDEHERENFQRWFNTRGNIVILNQILEQEAETMSAASEQRLEVITQWEETRFKPELLQMPLPELFRKMFEESSLKDEFISLLSLYFPKLADQFALKTPMPLRTVMYSQLWSKAIDHLSEMKNSMLDEELEKDLHSNKAKLITEYFKMLNDQKLDNSQRLRHVVAVIARKSKLGDVLTSPTKEEFIKELKRLDPGTYESYLRLSSTEDDLSIGLKLRHLHLIVTGLLAKELMPVLTVEDKEFLMANRKPLAAQVIQYFREKHPSREAEQIARLSTVIEGKNALGKLLAERPTGLFSWFAPNPRDEKGNAVSTFIAMLIDQRNTLSGIIASKNEAKKSSPPRQQHKS